MKNSDMKVIAIILSIALFFTIVTSNIVSIASIGVLLTGGTAAPADQGGNGGNGGGGNGGQDVDDSGLATDEDSMEKEDRKSVV